MHVVRGHPGTKMTDVWTYIHVYNLNIIINRAAVDMTRLYCPWYRDHRTFNWDENFPSPATTKIVLNVVCYKFKSSSDHESYFVCYFHFFNVASSLIVFKCMQCDLMLLTSQLKYVHLFPDNAAILSGKKIARFHTISEAQAARNL